MMSLKPLKPRFRNYRTFWPSVYFLNIVWDWRLALNIAKTEMRSPSWQYWLIYVTNWSKDHTSQTSHAVNENICVLKYWKHWVVLTSSVTSHIFWLSRKWWIIQSFTECCGKKWNENVYAFFVISFLTFLNASGIK